MTTEQIILYVVAIISVPIVLFAIVSVLVMAGIYWTHYPYGRKGRKNGSRKNS